MAWFAVILIWAAAGIAVGRSTTGIVYMPRLSGLVALHLWWAALGPFAGLAPGGRR